MRFYRPLAAVQAITFDLDDTLYNNDPIIRHADQALKDYLNERYPVTAAMSRSEWMQIKSTLVARQPALASDVGQLRLLSLEVALRADVPDTDARQQAAKACFDYFYLVRSDFTIDDTIHTTLAKLAAKVPLVGITNGNVDARRIGIAPYFTHILHASSQRPMKPAAHMFNEAATLLGMRPGNILHVGDNLEKDVFGAVRAGMQAAWFACNRTMDIRQEPVQVLPHIQLTALDDLLTVV